MLFWGELIPLTNYSFIVDRGSDIFLISGEDEKKQVKLETLPTQQIRVILSEQIGAKPEETYVIQHLFKWERLLPITSLNRNQLMHIARKITKGVEASFILINTTVEEVIEYDF